MCVNKIFWGTCGLQLRARLPTCAPTYVRYVRAYVRAPPPTCARPNKWRTGYVQNTHVYFVLMCVCVCVNVSWRFCKWSGIAFTHGYVRKCVRRTCGRHFRTSQHQKSEGIKGKDMIGWRSRCQRSSGWMCFGAKVAGRGTRPAQLRGTRAA